MNPWLLLLLCCLAVYRGARMVTKEAGPFDAFTKLRNLWTEANDWKAVGVRCPLCVGFWLALPAGLVYAVWAGDVWLWPLYWFGIAGGAVFLRKFWLERDE